MERVLRGVVGGIRGLLELIDEHEEAIRYDLLKLGLRLEHVGSKRFTWLDFKTVVANCDPTGALARAIVGDAAGWTLTDHLLASVVDVGQVANWQRGGGKGQRPKPIKRPDSKGDQKYGKDAIKISEFDEWWEGN